MSQRHAIVALVFCASISSATAQVTNCAAVLGSVHDKTTVQRYYVASHSFRNFFCERTFSNVSEARDAGAQVGIVIDGLPLQLGGHSRESNWSAYQHELCHLIETRETVDDRTFLQLEQVNARVIEAWERCVTSAQPGLYFYAETDDAARTVSFKTRFVGVGNNNLTTRLPNRALSITPANVLQCTTNFPTVVGPSIETVTCSRPLGSDAAVTAVLRTRSVGSPNAAVPGVHPTVIPRKVCTNPTLLSRGAPADASSNSAEAPAVTDGNTNPGNWNALAPAAQFVQIHLNPPMTIHHITLNPEQTPSGRTVNIISAFRPDVDGKLEEVVLQSLDMPTMSGGIVTVLPDQQPHDVSKLKVHTVVSPSFVSWREIEIFGCRP